jgi:hypothetical protein
LNQKVTQPTKKVTHHKNVEEDAIGHRTVLLSLTSSSFLIIPLALKIGYKVSHLSYKFHTSTVLKVTS